MKPPASSKPRQHLRLSDIRAVTKLPTQATSGVTEIVEGVHQSVLNTMGISSAGATGKTAGVPGLVYRSIHGITQLLGKGLEATMIGLEPLLQSDAEAKPGSPQREIFLAALNGVMGDRLVEADNPFAIPMTLHYENKALDLNSLPAMPEISGKIVVLIHGLCMNDLQQHADYRAQMPDHGTALAQELGYSPVYLRYNTGMHTSHNGHELAALLEQLLVHWPVPIEELSIVAHSMGGLVTRSAFHYARQDDLHWPDHLKNMVFLGTPHHGAPLERAGNWLDVLLGSTPYTKPFTSLGQLRSSGITDLRYGHALDEDWRGHDRFHRQPDERHFLPLPENVACYTVAATTAARRSTLADRLIGDGLVPLHSALGHHDDAQRSLKFACESQWIAYRTNHMGLLSSPDVTRQVVNWLAPAE